MGEEKLHIIGDPHSAYLGTTPGIHASTYLHSIAPQIHFMGAIHSAPRSTYGDRQMAANEETG